MSMTIKYWKGIKSWGLATGISVIESAKYNLKLLKLTTKIYFLEGYHPLPKLPLKDLEKFFLQSS